MNDEPIYIRVAFTGYIIIEVPDGDEADKQFAAEMMVRFRDVFHAAAAIPPMVHESGFHVMDPQITEHVCEAYEEEV